MKMLVVPWIKKNCFMLTFQSWCLQFSDFSEINLGIQLVHNFSDIHSGIQVIHNFSEIHSYQISYKKLEPLSNFIIILDTTIAIAIAIATAITIASKTSGSIKTPASMMSSTPLRQTPPPNLELRSSSTSVLESLRSRKPHPLENNGGRMMKTF